MQIGIEYEGARIGHSNMIYEPFDRSLLDHLIKPIDGPWPETQYLYTQYFTDNYEALAEIRMLPVDIKEVEKFTEIFIKLLTTFKNVFWGEAEIDLNRHKQSIESLEKHREENVQERRRARKEEMGEIIIRDLKQPLTIIENEIVPFISDPDNRFRGGGLHINVSPVSPSLAKDFAMMLHGMLRHINESFDFKSDYRQRLLFRYKDFNGVPGIEYMTVGFNYAMMSNKQLRAIIKNIFSSVETTFNHFTHGKQGHKKGKS